MSLYFTQHTTATSSASVPTSARISEVFVQSWAGQAGEAEFFRIGNEGEQDQSILIYSSAVSSKVT